MRKVRNLRGYCMKMSVFRWIFLFQVFQLSQLQGQPSSEPCRRQLQALRSSGYFLANVELNKNGHCTVIKGEPFQFAVSQMSGAGLVKDTKYAVSEFSQQTEDWLTMMENTGFPFASVQFFPDSISGNTVYLGMKVETGPECQIDSFAGFRPEKLKGLIRNAAGIKYGDVYNQQKLNLLRQRLAGLSAYRLSGADDVYFSQGKLTVNMGLQRARKDKLTGILGFATSENARPVLTGEADMAFYDLFGYGVSFTLNWRSFAPLSQQLAVGAELPYFFRSPVILLPSIQFEKLDTQFTRFRRSIAVRVPVDANKSFSVGADFTGINALTINADQVLALRRLPASISMNTSLYFASLEWKNNSSGELPVKGFDAAIKAGAGSRNIVRDNQIAEKKWISADGQPISIYDSLENLGKMKLNQFKISYQLNYYVKLKKYLILKLSAEGEELRTPTVYYSELNRWGGLGSLRGYPEQSIFANRFHMGTAEMRIQSEATGYLAPFVSVAWNENDAGRDRLKNRWLVGTGLAFAVRTAAGVLKLAWATGLDADNAFKFSNTRIHAGISNAF